ncbi:MAG: PAS domain S-box protein [Desulfobacteraceae bacterium]|nr:PAS domain S-box protein [Desulfobacteraceae bacterium]
MSDKPTCEELEERVRELEKEASNPEGDHRYRQLFDTINDAVLVHLIDDNGFPRHFIQVNDIACQRLGYTRQELLQLNPHDIGTGDDTLGVDKIRETLMANGRAFFETVHVTKDGRKLPVESNVRTFEISGQRAVLSISRDISERKRAEEALRKSETRYKSLVELSPEAVFVHQEGIIVYHCCPVNSLAISSSYLITCPPTCSFA